MDTHKWYVRKGYLKIHVAVDIKKKKRILSLEVISEEVHDDGRMLSKLVDNASENNNLEGVLADDGMYDSNNNFRYLSKNQIKPTPTKISSLTHSQLDNFSYSD
jgi:hypothetical protein